MRIQPTPTLAGPRRPHRSGITLTEILIAILIMGVGLVSLATLFPLGLLRIQRAMRDSRSTFLARSAFSDVDARNLLRYDSFYLCKWYTADPWLDERPNALVADPIYLASGSTSAGLPVCYDPLWWAVVHQNGGAGSTPANATLRTAARLGGGTGFLRNDPSGGVASAWGLQRITNFRNWPIVSDPLPSYPFVYYVPNASVTVNFKPPDATDAFYSPDNIIFTGEDEESPGQRAGAPSPLLPDLSLSADINNNPTTTYDVSYTWFFTGFRPNANDVTQYTGSIVVCHNRVMGVEAITTPAGGTATVPIGERVYEAVFGYSGRQVQRLTPTATIGFGRNDRSVLLRWSDTQPDPVLKAGSYVADVTYEPSISTYNARFPAGVPYSGQRCEWYRVQGTTTPEADAEFPRYRRMIVTLDTPVRAKTLVNATGANAGQPVTLNAALVMPSVVNVFPHTFVTRGDR